MADGGGGTSTGGKGIGKVLQRTVTRTKAKVLQNFGKADKTRDDEFEQHLHNFNEQQNTALRLQKDLKQYVACMKEMSLASQNMYKNLRETYEPNWTGYTDIITSSEMMSHLWEEYQSRLSDGQASLNAYSAHFPEMKAKIAKRGRKLTDYDNARHNHEQMVNSKKQDDAKMNKIVEELNDAKHIYETINTELHEELPNLYQSRVGFLASYFNNLLTAEAVFHRESAKLQETMAEVSGHLCTEADSAGAASPVRITKPVKQDRDSGGARNPSSSVSSPVSPSGGAGAGGYFRETSSDVKKSNIEVAAERGVGGREESGGVGQYNGSSATSPTQKTTNGSMSSARNNVHDDDDDDDDYNRGYETTGNRSSKPSSPQTNTVYSLEARRNSDADDEHYKVPTSPAGVERSSQLQGILFKVVATHRYQGDDVDELSFEPGDILSVIPYDDPEDQDDGWLMGVKESTNDRGVFPENFTRRLE